MVLEQYEQIELASGVSQRIEILRSLPPILIKGFVYALDPQKRYHVTPKSVPEARGFGVADEVFLHMLFYTLDQCLDGRLRGNLAKQAIQNLFAIGSDLQRKWASRIIYRNMSCGVGWGLFTAAISDTGLKAFSARLCGKYNHNQLKGRWAIEPKLDGMRCYMVFQNGECEILSRSGKPVPGGLPVGRSIADTDVMNDMVLDGELIEGDRFKSISSSRKASGDKSGLRYHVFDTIPIDKWQKGTDETLYHRRLRLIDLCQTAVAKNTRLSDNLVVVDSKPLLDLSSSNIIKEVNQLVSSGYEGGVLKCIDSPYKFERSDEWLKCKLTETDDFLVVDIVRGRGRLRNTTGNLVVDVNGVRVGVGTGLSDSDRAHFWANKDKLVNSCIVEVGHEGQTPDGSLNFPRFIRIRTDKSSAGTSKS
jgi:hypothetical protein